MNDRHLEALLGRPEGGERPEARATDLYQQHTPGAPFQFVKRYPDATPLDAVREYAEERGADPRIARNYWNGDVWTLEPMTAPHRIATVWRAEENGELPKPPPIWEGEE